MNELRHPLIALLVDDEAYFRRFVAQVLTRMSINRVVEARDGHEAVRLFETSAPDFVLLDISMPHMDGLQTLSALRALSATVPIVMLTSLAEERVVEQCVSQGATFFIRKDVPAQELSAALGEVLHQFVGEKRST